MRSTTCGATYDLSHMHVLSVVLWSNMKAIVLMEVVVISVQEVSLHPYESYWYDRSGKTSFIQWKMKKTPRTYIPSPHLYQYGKWEVLLVELTMRTCLVLLYKVWYSYATRKLSLWWRWRSLLYGFLYSHMKAIGMMEVVDIIIVDLNLPQQTHFIQYNTTITPRTFIPSPHLYQYGKWEALLMVLPMTLLICMYWAWYAYVIWKLSFWWRWWSFLCKKLFCTHMKTIGMIEVDRSGKTSFIQFKTTIRAVLQSGYTFHKDLFMSHKNLLWTST